MASVKKKKPARKASKRNGKDKKYVTGSKLNRKNSFIKWLRILFILVIVVLSGAIAIRLGYFRQAKKAIVETAGWEENNDLNDVIAATCADIGITEENFQLYNKEDHIYITIGVNQQEMDLLLVNSIITGKVEASGGKLINAKESASGSYQLIEYHAGEKSKPYLIRLYYGKYEEQGKEIYMIIDDLGSYKGELLDEFCRIDENITFAIIPNEPYYNECMLKANASGHDIMLHLPMEPMDIKNNNPGEKAILVDYSPARIKEYTRWALERVPLAIGANNHMGSLATSMESVMIPVMEVMQESGMFFIDSFTTANSIVSRVASQEMVMSSRRDIFLDNVKLDAKAMEEKLKKLNKIAERKDQIIVISHCHSKEKLEFAKEFIEKAQAEGYRFLRISRLFSSAARV